MSTERRGLLFVLPSYRASSAGIDPFWITAAGLARAVGARLGGADVLSPFGLLAPEDLTANAIRTTTSESVVRDVALRLPRTVRTALGDVRAWRRAGRLRKGLDVLDGRSYRLVMQIHRRFHDAGLIAARRDHAPFVLRVDALETREERSWGVRRPGWGRVVERVGELRLIRSADLVAAVSDEVNELLATAGIDEERRIVVSSAVDTTMFSPGEPDEELLRGQGLGGRFVVGWIGGFRPFHGLEIVPDVVRSMRTRVPDAVLCLLGTGSLRAEIARRLRDVDDRVRFIDPVPHEMVPRWLKSFDACLVLAGSGRFHYSPLKLYEYLACGRPVVAPAVGEMSSVLSNGSDALLVAPGEPDAIVDAIERLSTDAALRARIGEEARRTVERIGSWDTRARTLLDALNARGLLPTEPVLGS